MGYSLNIFDLSHDYTRFSAIYNDIATRYNLSYFHKESLYDWIVTEALNQVLQLRVQGKVIGHTTHDVCRHVYSDYLVDNESLGFHFEKSLAYQLQTHNVNFYMGENVKAMVLQTTLLIARGNNATT